MNFLNLQKFLICTYYLGLFINKWKEMLFSELGIKRQQIIYSELKR